ncbi:unnamed protein product, partial [Oppiella nova]
MLSLSLNGLGFRVYATVYDTNTSGTQMLSKECRFTAQMVVIKMDVTNDQEVRHVYQQVSEDLTKNNGVLWSVVNNAGIGLFGRLDWGSLESIQNVFEVNVFGVLRVTRIFLPLIKQSK